MEEKFDDELFEMGDDSAESGDLYDKIVDESTSIGRLLGKIPGFKGYMERSRRREADDMLRTTIARQLEEARLQLGTVYQALSRDIIKAIDFAEPLGRADSRLAGLIGKIKAAPTGYAGLFDAVKIKEEDLQRIYEFDENMIGHADLIAAGVAALDKAVRDNGDIATSIRGLDNSLQDAILTFNARHEMMSGVA